MGVHPAALDVYAAPAGQLEYRLARNFLVGQYLKGYLDRNEICDAQPELMRVATHHGVLAEEPCPVCSEWDLVYVSFAFGKGLPPSGRLLVDPAEIERLRRAPSAYRCYVVEVCRGCRFNHLSKAYSL